MSLYTGRPRAQVLGNALTLKSSVSDVDHVLAEEGGQLYRVPATNIVAAGESAPATRRNLGVRESFDTVALLQADTLLAYSANSSQRQVTPGDIIEAGGFRYQVAASDATDHHLTTVGGVKLYRSDWLALKAALLNVADDDVPTVTVGTSQTLSGGDLIQATPDFYGDPNFRFDGCLDVREPSAGYVGATLSDVGVVYYANPEFVTEETNDEFEAKVYVPSAGNDIGVRVIVDGKMHSWTLERFSATASTVHYIKVAFPTARARRITLEIESISRWQGVIVPSGEGLARPPGSVRKAVGILGDSFFRGADYNNDGASGLETAGYYIARLMGADRIVNFAIGGTGWVEAGSSDVFGSRVPEILASGVSALVVGGSRNDSGESGIYAAALSCLSALDAIPLVTVCGPAQTGFSAVNTAVQSATGAAGRQFIDMQEVITDDREHTDGVHPSADGHTILALEYFNQMDTSETQAALLARPEKVTLTLSGNGYVAAGTSPVITATVSTAQGGAVSFYRDGELLETVAVSSGTATTTLSSISAGSYTITAAFVPTNRYAAQVATDSFSITAVAALGFTDTFTRADGAPVETEDTPPKPYVTFGSGGTWTISSNKLQNKTVASSTHYIAVDADAPDGEFEVTISGAVPNAGGLGLRIFSQTNCLRLTVQSGQIQLQQVVANSSTVVATGSSGPWVDGDTIKVILDGDFITVKVNDVTVAGLDAVECATWNDQTHFGVFANAASDCEYDNLDFVELT